MGGYQIVILVTVDFMKKRRHLTCGFLCIVKFCFRARCELWANYVNLFSRPFIFRHVAMIVSEFFLAINACPQKDSTLSTFWRTSRIQSRRAVSLGIGDLINVVDTSTIPPIEDVMHNPQNMTTSFTPSKLTMVD